MRRFRAADLGRDAVHQQLLQGCASSTDGSSTTVFELDDCVYSGRDDWVFTGTVSGNATAPSPFSSGSDTSSAPRSDAEIDAECGPQRFTTCTVTVRSETVGGDPLVVGDHRLPS